jgi:Cof subfamily protein (haloacid dehalogenase superfamily)
MDIDQSGLYQPILNKTMSVAEVKKIEYLAKRMNVHISFYVNDEWYVEKLDYWAKQEQDIAKTLPTVTGFQALYHLFDRTNTGPNKVLCMGDEDEIERLELSLKKEMYGELTVYRSKPTYLEIMHHTVSKTSAIRFLHEKLKIKQSEIIAVGDNFNDIDMLQYSGIGVAMGNAPKQVKEIADKMTLTNDDHGVAKVIEKYLL